jgi:hypothetical protein
VESKSKLIHHTTTIMKNANRIIVRVETKSTEGGCMGIVAFLAPTVYNEIAAKACAKAYNQDMLESLGFQKVDIEATGLTPGRPAVSKNGTWLVAPKSFNLAVAKAIVMDATPTELATLKFKCAKMVDVEKVA